MNASLKTAKSYLLFITSAFAAGLASRFGSGVHTLDRFECSGPVLCGLVTHMATFTYITNCTLVQLLLSVTNSFRQVN